MRIGDIGRAAVFATLAGLLALGSGSASASVDWVNGRTLFGTDPGPPANGRCIGCHVAPGGIARPAIAMQGVDAAGIDRAILDVRPMNSISLAPSDLSDIVEFLKAPTLS
ncbi:MAG: hypothetical protein ABI589_09440, partial [Burkholderiales bacterium]